MRRPTASSYELQDVPGHMSNLTRSAPRAYVLGLFALILGCGREHGAPQTTPWIRSPAHPIEARIRAITGSEPVIRFVSSRPVWCAVLEHRDLDAPEPPEPDPDKGVLLCAWGEKMTASARTRLLARFRVSWSSDGHFLTVADTGSLARYSAVVWPPGNDASALSPLAISVSEEPTLPASLLHRCATTMGMPPYAGEDEIAENTARAHAEVAASVALCHRYDSNRLVVFIAPKPGASVDVAGLEAEIRGRLTSPDRAGPSAPSVRVLIRESLPTAPTETDLWDLTSELEARDP